MSMLQTVLKITIYWLFSTYLHPFLALASVKYLETRQSCENDFRQYYNLKNLFRGFLKILQFPIFDFKKESLDKYFSKNYIVKKASTVYHELYQLSQNFTEGNMRKVRLSFLHLHLFDIIQFRDDHMRMRIRGSLAPVACSKF